MEVKTAKPIAILDRMLHRLDMQMNNIDGTLSTIAVELQEIKQLLRESQPFPYNLERR